MKRKYLLIILVIIVIIYFISGRITPIIKKIADKEINRFCQMIINNVELPIEVDHQKLVNIKRSGDTIVSINFDTSYASGIGAQIVDELEKIFYTIEAGKYKKKDNSIYQLKLEEVSKNNGIIASVHLGMLSNNPFLADFGPKINIKYKSISAITSSLDKEIKSYGVNHIMISLNIIVKIKLMVLVPFYGEEFNKSYDYPLIMEIIEGEVPNWYQN
ncbi:sporulation protein YunB [Thomasclavelia sp.]|uniref:sporulation protein YunB n=1 Tax=Thomasclavelia sp. TaxID=3025757 RepID=UPI00261AB1C9|nr:sporulation protein YunB [Thomasclavelia sp.]